MPSAAEIPAGQPGASGREPLRVVILTSGGREGVLVLDALRRYGVVPAAVIVHTDDSLRACFRNHSTRARLAELPLVPLRFLRRRLRPRFSRGILIGAPVMPTRALNSRRMRRDLARTRPDILVLAGTGIVSADVLAIPRLATLNVHPGLLPWARGNGVVEHSILRGVAVGMTCYVVDTGIDTGAIVRRRLLDVTQVEPSLTDIEQAGLRAGANLLAEVIRDSIAAAAMPATTIQTERFPLCQWLPVEQRGEVDALVAAGRARELFDEWAPLADGVTGDLPESAVVPRSLSIRSLQPRGAST